MRLLDAVSRGAPASAGRAKPATPRALAAVAADAPPVAMAIRHLEVPLPAGALRIDGWQVARGEKVAVIGRNGVGKTSLSEALLGLREDAKVDALLLGHEVRRWRREPALRRRLGVQLQHVAFPGRPRVKELVDMHRAFYGFTSGRVMEALGIEALAGRLYEHMSRGETQRVDLFLALAHEPELLFLDEPFTGLDAQHARRLAELLRDLPATTLVMCCHTVEELALATRIAWLVPGRLAAYDTPASLRDALVGAWRLFAACEDAATAQAIGDTLRPHLPAAARLVVEGAHVVLAGEHSFGDIARELMERPGVLVVEAGRSGPADLLRHCAREH